jgi:hypothetical protein
VTDAEAIKVATEFAHVIGNGVNSWKLCEVCHEPTLYNRHAPKPKTCGRLVCMVATKETTLL